MAGKGTTGLADDDSGVGPTQLGDQQGHEQRVAAPGVSDNQVSGVATPATARPEDQEATPPEHKGLMAAIDRHLSKGFEKQSETLSELKLGFESVNKNLTKMHVRVQKVENKVTELDNDQTKLTKIILDTRTYVRQNIVRLTDLEKDKSATKASIDSMQQQIDDLSEKMISITDVMEQLRSGKLGTYTDLEAPTLKDQYDMKVAFMKRKHGIGFFPIYQEHLDAIIATNTCSEVDAYRISVSQFLQLEMAFEEAFVVNLENHYVEIQYNKLDTVYVVFDDLDISGARRIWQESKQLRKRQTGDMDRDPRLIPMDLPQFRDRLAAMKKYASHLRWEWNRANEDKFQDGERFMTRVVEAKENGEDIYDFIVQAKPPGEEFDRVAWPANRSLPKIQWKNKEYKHHREFILKVKRDDQVRKNFDPPGRPLVLIDAGAGRGQQRITFQPTVHTYRPEHQYIPGVVDPEARSRMSLSEAGGITPWMSEQITLGSHEQRGQQTSTGASETQQGAAAGETAGGQPDQVEPEPTKEEQRRKEQQEEYDRTVARLEEKERKLKEEKEKKELEAKERKERLEKQIRDRANREKRPIEEILKEMEEEERARKAEEDRKDKEKADRLRALGGVSFGFGGSVEFQSSSMMEEPEEGKSEEELDREMLELRERTVAEERKRWEEDERNRLEREAIEEELRQNKYEMDMAKKAREEALLKLDPGRNLVTDVDNFDSNGNRGNYIVATPQPPTGTKPKEVRSTKKTRRSPKSPLEDKQEGEWQEMTKEEEEDAVKAAADVTLNIPSSQMSELTFTPSTDAETILAKAPLTARPMPRTGTKQPSITSFMMRRSSTLTESQIATDDESDAEVFGTPTSGTLESPNRTLPLQEDTGASSASPNLQSVSKSLQFTDENYHLVPITPAGSQTEVKVLARKDMGKIQPSKLPLPRNQQTIEQQRRRDSLKKRWSTNSAATQPKSSKLTFGSAKPSKPVKRVKETDSGEKDTKINRVKSPETGTKGEASDTEASEPGTQANQETNSEVNNAVPEGAAANENTEEPKEENTTASSDDLSSLSVLEVGASEVNVSESDVEADDLENTVILKETGEQSQQADELTPLGDEPLREEVETGPAKTVIIVNETPDVKQSPDKMPTPPPDATGHIISVQTYAAGVTVNSDPEAGVRMAMASLIAGAPRVPTPNTEKKKAEASQID